MSATTARKPRTRATPTPKAPPSITLDVKTFKRFIKTVAPAASGDEFRPILTGVHIRRAEVDGPLVITATDSYRLYRITTRNEPGGQLIEATVPARWLTRLLPGLGADDVTLTIDGPRVTVASGDDIASTAIIRGGYVKADDLLAGIRAKPTVDELPVWFNPKLYGDVLKAAATFGGPRWPVQMTLRGNSLSPVEFHVTDAEGARLDMVLMPVRAK